MSGSFISDGAENHMDGMLHEKSHPINLAITSTHWLLSCDGLKRLWQQRSESGGNSMC